MITSLYASLFAFMFVGLSIYVIKGRRRYKIPLGDAGEYAMRQRMRAHGNFAEYTPFFVVLLALVEYQGLPFYAVHALGLLFLFGRINHAYGLGYAERLEGGKLQNVKYRIRGMVCTFIALLMTASILIIQLLFYTF